MSTKGAFLKEKWGNMARWVTEEVGQENLPVDIIAGINGRSELELTMLSATLQANEKEITHRNWSGLMQLLDAEKHIPKELQEVLLAVQRNDAMHDKFWRYMRLFVQVCEQ